MKFKHFYLLGLLPLFASCTFNISPDNPPSDNIVGLSWSADDSSVYVARERSFDSTGTTFWNYFIEQYNLRGTLLSSIQLKKSPIPNWTILGIISGGQCLLVEDRNGISFADGNLSMQTPIQPNGYFESISPSGNIIATDSNFAPVADMDGIDGWYQLTRVFNGNSRVIQHWKTHVQMFPSLKLLSDRIFTFEEYVTGGNQFSVYDSNLNILYRMSDPSGSTQAVSYVPSINGVFVTLNSYGPDLSVEFIDLNTSTVSRNAFNQEIIGTAPDGFHIAYLRDHLTLTIRNLFTNAEKEISSDYPSVVSFSPDSSHLCYFTGVPPEVKVVALNGLP